MYSIQITKANSETNTDIYTVWGNETDKATVASECGDRMASGSLFLTTDKTGNMKIYKWDENAKEWSEL